MAHGKPQPIFPNRQPPRLAQTIRTQKVYGWHTAVLFCIFANHTLAKYMMNTHKTNTPSALRTDRLKAAKPRFTDATEKLAAYWLAPSSRGVVLQYEFRCRLYKRTLKMNLFQN